MTLDCEVVTTRSGALAMRDRVTGEVMHPVVGPLVEAEHVYVAASRLKARLDAPGLDALRVLDVGLGAGSSALAAWRACETRSRERPLEIVSFDRSAAALELALRAEHAAAFNLNNEDADAARALLSSGACNARRRQWRLHLGELPGTLELEAEHSADIVFWDPFSHAANPELWTLAAFARVRRLCRAGATLHTYSGATATRSALLLAGFFVGEGPLVGPERRSTIAALSPDDLELPLAERWLARVTRSSSAFPADAPADALARLEAHPQFAR